ncbi:MAG: hypothetical protein COB90_06085 [Hyphomicrobiales bacterium]|nr:MAG: hypothetical protein COB90_06085 [Hyphomicrobiales bacterium]
MSWYSAFAIYFIFWWVTLFVILPFGVRSQKEDGEMILGTDQGAPTNPSLLKKSIWTTFISGVLFALYFYAYTQMEIGIEFFDFMPGPK